MAVTSVTIALALAREMASTNQPNTGMLQADTARGQSMIPAYAAGAIWISGMPESVLFPTMPAWDATTTPANPTMLVDATAIGCSVCYISDYVKRGGSLDDVAAAVDGDNYLTLNTLANAPDWDTFIQDMRNVGWRASNDPLGVWLSTSVASPAPAAPEDPVGC